MQPSVLANSVSAAESLLIQQFQKVRKQTERLVEPLSTEDCQLQSMPDASPAKWHLAHLTWFFETLILEKYERGFKPFDASFRVLYNSYYTGIGDRYPRAQRGLISRPSLQQIFGYRRQVDERVIALLESPQGRSNRELAQLVTLGLQHEQQHQELLLTDIKHALSFNPSSPAYAQRWPLTMTHPQPQRWIYYAGGLVQHGFDNARDGDFSFDNETPRHSVHVAPFRLASRLLTNGDVMAFMADGGYRRPELWLSMGWDWVESGPRDRPLYWESAGSGDAYRNFTLQGAVEVDSNTPACHLSYFEADAMARWAGARLPTEFEWELAARSLSPDCDSAANFVERAAYHPLPMRSPAHHEALAQMMGDVWEWTQSNYNPYPGYQPWEGLVGEYNGKFMCNQFVLRGGSCATPQSHARASYRNFFPPDAQWQFSGVRLARNA